MTQFPWQRIIDLVTRDRRLSIGRYNITWCAHVLPILCGLFTGSKTNRLWCTGVWITPPPRITHTHIHTHTHTHTNISAAIAPDERINFRSGFEVSGILTNAPSAGFCFSPEQQSLLTERYFGFFLGSEKLTSMSICFSHRIGFGDYFGQMVAICIKAAVER